MTPRIWCELLKQSLADWNEDDAPRLGASLAFYTILSMSPLVILGVAVASLVFSRSSAQAHLLARVQVTIGTEGREAVGSMLASGQKEFSGVSVAIDIRLAFGRVLLILVLGWVIWRGLSLRLRDSPPTRRSDTTAQIRKAIVADKSLSTYAHNVKVITVNGAVTLKGPVYSDDEKEKVASDAAGVVSADKITNQLTVKQ
jgi:BON domain/Virulence factor BrkB